MRASELIGAPVFDENGVPLGVVHDLCVALDGFEIAALVVGERGARSAAAHAWGFAQDRVAGPALLRRALAPAGERSFRVPADLVLDWGPERLQVTSRD
jgi:sporulation protein YlmC with PRC-barrel domain